LNPANFEKLVPSEGVNENRRISLSTIRKSRCDVIKITVVSSFDFLLDKKRPCPALAWSVD
jgi:hypothetical protein